MNESQHHFDIRNENRMRSSFFRQIFSLPDRVRFKFQLCSKTVVGSGFSSALRSLYKLSNRVSIQITTLIRARSWDEV